MDSAKLFALALEMEEKKVIQSEEEQVGMGELGMMWQKQALIKKACEWLENNLFDYPWYDNDAPNFTIDDIINDFKKAMEE